MVGECVRFLFTSCEGSLAAKCIIYFKSCVEQIPYSLFCYMQCFHFTRVFRYVENRQGLMLYFFNKRQGRGCHRRKENEIVILNYGI